MRSSRRTDMTNQKVNLAREWDAAAEDMIDFLNLGDKAVVDVRTGDLKAFYKQPVEVQKIWAEAIADRDGN
jgi:hypothetical protein